MPERPKALDVQIAALRGRLVLCDTRRFAVDFPLACLDNPRLARFPCSHAPAVGVSTLGRLAPAVIAGCVWVYHLARIPPSRDIAPAGIGMGLSGPRIPWRCQDCAPFVLN